ncbi:MAG TPA: elongation factor G [Spirochaetota bacterium]|nr:elongation factor G [Spirochaetota bacterium]HOM38605.1 elongation factor G [Spirochaetota bacterium]HPQ49742.1 elongation factor G [Spirochaetota bacterium]
MKKHPTIEVRNVAVVGHNNTGKTSLVEALLLYTGVISEAERGKICDFDDEEKKKGFSIHSSIVSFEYSNIKINIIDTPGISDFVGDVFAALRAVESVIILADAEFGIQIETEKVWEYANEYNIPRIVFINKMDKEEADFFKVAKEMEDRFHVPVVPLEIPIGKGKDFKGVINLIKKKAYYVKNGFKVEESEIPKEYEEIFKEYYDKLVSVVAETSAELEEKYLEGSDFTENDIREGLSKCIKTFKIVSIVCGSAQKVIGIYSLLEILKDEMPDPYFIGEVMGSSLKNENDIEVRECKDSQPFCGFVFKTRIDPYTGRINYIKVESGKIKPGDTILVVKDKNNYVEEKVIHIYSAVGEKLDEVEEIVAGDIGVIVKSENMHTGNTVCDPKNPIILQPLKVLNPIYFLSFKVDDKNIEEKFIEEISKYHEEDPTFKLEYDPTTKEHLLKGMGELHLNLIVDKISTKLKTNVKTALPKVPYKETIKLPFKSHYKHKKQSGGRGQYGEVFIEVEPLARGKGFEFVDKIFGGHIPKQYIPGVEKGIREAMEEGVIAGYPVTDIRVILVDGSFHPVDSSELAFKIAAWHALKEGLKTAKNIIIEPIMRVKIMTENSITGDILNDLNSRHGKVLEIRQAKGDNEDKNSVQIIEAYVPLKDMLTYAIDLKSISKGKSNFEMEFSHYDVLPDIFWDKAIGQNKNL